MMLELTTIVCSNRHDELNCCLFVTFSIGIRLACERLDMNRRYNIFRFVVVEVSCNLDKSASTCMLGNISGATDVCLDLYVLPSPTTLEFPGITCSWKQYGTVKT